MVVLLKHVRETVVYKALRLLSRLEPSVLLQYSVQVTALLADDEGRAAPLTPERRTLLEATLRVCGKFDASELAIHAEAIAAYLDHPELTIRKEAVMALSPLANATDLPWAPASRWCGWTPARIIVNALDDAELKVRQAAIKALKSFDVVTILRIESEIDNALEHEDPRVRSAAVKALGRLELADVLRHNEAFATLMSKEENQSVVDATVANLKVSVLGGGMGGAEPRG